MEVMPLAMHLRLSFTNALPCGGKKIKEGRGQKTGAVHTVALSRSHPYRPTPAQRGWVMLGERRALYLSVKFSSTVQEGLADVIHAICVTS